MIQPEKISKQEMILGELKLKGVDVEGAAHLVIASSGAASVLSIERSTALTNRWGFSNAEMVGGASGATLTNIMFAPPSCRVLSMMLNGRRS